jgi:NDP-sugar pyrophosphorylase family protein
MKLLVLAGGFGTRLKSAVSDVPKASVFVKGVPSTEIVYIQEHQISPGYILCGLVKVQYFSRQRN